METFSKDDIVSKYITNANVRRTYLESVYRYLVQRKYFKLVRQLLEEKMPPIYDVVLSPPNSISETLLQMIQHPLRLMSPASHLFDDNQKLNEQENSMELMISKECVTLILSSFVEEILIPEYTKPIQLFVIPCLANDPEFPFPHLLQFLNDFITQDTLDAAGCTSIQQDSEFCTSNDSSYAHTNLKDVDNLFNSPFAFHSCLILDQLHLQRIKHNSVLVRNYINVLGYFSENIRKLQQRSSHPLLKQYDMDIEADEDIDSDDESDHKIESISSSERHCLIEAITFLNDQNRVVLILDNIESNLDDVHVLYSLCKICHNLMLYHRSAVFEFRYVQ